MKQPSAIQRSRDLRAATGSMALAVVVLLVVLVAVLAAVPSLRTPPVPIQTAPGRTGAHAVAAAIAPAAQVQADFAALRGAIDGWRAAQGRIPADDSQLRQAWRDRYAPQPFPADPYANGQPYAYRATGDEFSLTSAGPNLRFSSAGQ